MTTFLFWNLMRQPRQSIITRLAAHHHVDVLILAECAIPEADMVAALGTVAPFHRTRILPGRGVDAYSRFAPACFGRILQEADHYTIRPLRVPDGIEILLAVAHLASTRFKKAEDLRDRCIGLGVAIREAERSANHTRTLLIGDLNVNPFHPGMLSVYGLNALADRATVPRKDPRRFGKVNPQEFRLFYNPMWSHFGDVRPPPGTYYYDKTNPEVDPLWNIFDQVLLRAELLPRFHSEDLRILTGDGVVPFAKPDGRPNADLASDHFPILFRVELRQAEASP